MARKLTPEKGFFATGDIAVLTALAVGRPIVAVTGQVFIGLALHVVPIKVLSGKENRRLSRLSCQMAHRTGQTHSLSGPPVFGRRVTAPLAGLTRRLKAYTGLASTRLDIGVCRPPSFLGDGVYHLGPCPRSVMGVVYPFLSGPFARHIHPEEAIVSGKLLRADVAPLTKGLFPDGKVLAVLTPFLRPPDLTPPPRRTWRLTSVLETVTRLVRL